MRARGSGSLMEHRFSLHVGLAGEQDDDSKGRTVFSWRNHCCKCVARSMGYFRLVSSAYPRRNRDCYSGDHAMIEPQYRSRMVGLLVTLAVSIVVLLAVGYLVKISGIASMPTSVKALPKSL